MSDYTGTIITGFCNGFFGRDSYEDKLILASGFINGRRWVTVKTSGYPTSSYYVTSAYDIPEETFQEWLQGEPEDNSEEEAYEEYYRGLNIPEAASRVSLEDL